MRRVGGLVLVCAAMAGCQEGRNEAFLRPKPTVSQAYSAGGFGKAFGNVAAIDQTPGLYLETVLFERSIGDAIIDRELWQNDAAFLPPRTRTLLDENGLRVAVFGGSLSRPLQKLLESNDGAVDPQRLTFANRSEVVIATAGTLEKCEYRVLASISGEPEKIEFQKVNCGWLVKPELLADGRIKVRCEPQVQHGERQDWIRPTVDGTGFALHGEVPVERYSSLGFEATLAPGEYLVIGSAADAADSLGSTMFTAEAKDEVHQRVLVIRAGYRGELRSDLPALPRSRGGHAIAVEAFRVSSFESKVSR
jgi:hypothetical protein